MKKRIIFGLLLVCALLPSICLFAGCEPGDGSTFSITFIDVGQGDSALVECDGQYMLIDGGDSAHGSAVYDVLEARGIQKLEILAISHFHDDHIGGLPKALSYAQSINRVIANAAPDHLADGKAEEALQEVKNRLNNIGAPRITVPHEGGKYKYPLGSAEVEVIAVGPDATKNDDSLVLLITYGKTRFLFTGDIEEGTQQKIANKYENDRDESFKINVMKIPHHGAKKNEYRFIRTFMPDYAVISVGKNNIYKHPAVETLDMLEQADVKMVYRTDLNGNIIVRSNGKSVKVEPSR